MSSSGGPAASAAVEHAARHSYGRLLAFLTARTRDVAVAQDALGDALCAALETWPHAGVPERPEAWLFAVARHRLIDRARRSAVAADAVETLLLLADELTVDSGGEAGFPDDRLKLMFVCAHPSMLEAAIQSAHARRAVTGFVDWEEVALLYEGLATNAPSVGAFVGRAAALAQARGAAIGWAHLYAIARDDVVDYQPYWALAAHLLAQLGRYDAARSAFDRAMSLCSDPAIRQHLSERAQAFRRGA